MMNGKGIVFNNNGLLLDPDNAFWAILNQKQDDYHLIPRKILSFYEKIKDSLDKQMQNFRFSANLTAIYIDPTDKCNANCPYCYIPNRIRKNGSSMTRRELFFILDEIGGYFRRQKRKPVIVFHAAEPLLVKDIIFEGIKKYSKEFKFGLQTNASLLEREDAQFLKKFQVGVGISLDYYSPKVNNLLRPLDNEAPRAEARGFLERNTERPLFIRTLKGTVFWPRMYKNGNFKAAIRAIEWFDGYEGINVITTITKFNVAGLSGMVDFLHSKRVPCVLFNPVRLTQKNSRILKPDERSMAKYFIEAVDKAIELSKKSKHRIIIGNFTNIILGIVAPAARRLMCDISPCGGGRCFLTITAKGEMIPCGEFIGLKGFSGGNIFAVGIKQAMQSVPFKKIRQRFVEKIDECKVCALRNICGAPCPAELHSLGNMYQKAVFCEFYKQIINHAFKLIAEGSEKFCFRKDGLDELQYEYRLA